MPQPSDGEWGRLNRETQNYSRSFDGSLDLEVGGEHMSFKQISEGVEVISLVGDLGQGEIIMLRLALLLVGSE